MLALLVLTVAMDIVGSSLVYLFEHDPHGPIATVGDSVFWTTTQLLTVSSQLNVPQTTGGKVVDVGLQLWAILVVTTLAGSWGAFFHQRRGSSSRSA
jgi:hypothetical protein